MTIESMGTDSRNEGGEVALAVFYALALLVGPFMAIMLWYAVFGLWGTDNPVQLGAIPPLLSLATPVVIGIVLGLRARPGSRAMLVAPAIPLAVVVVAFVWVADPHPFAWLAIAAVYALGPVALGRLAPRLRAGR